MPTARRGRDCGLVVLQDDGDDRTLPIVVSPCTPLPSKSEEPWSIGPVVMTAAAFGDGRCATQVPSLNKTGLVRAAGFTRRFQRTAGLLADARHPRWQTSRLPETLQIESVRRVEASDLRQSNPHPSVPCLLSPLVEAPLSSKAHRAQQQVASLAMVESATAGDADELHLLRSDVRSNSCLEARTAHGHLPFLESTPMKLLTTGRTPTRAKKNQENMFSAHISLRSIRREGFNGADEQWADGDMREGVESSLSPDMQSPTPSPYQRTYTHRNEQSPLRSASKIEKQWRYAVPVHSASGNSSPISPKSLDEFITRGDFGLGFSEASPLDAKHHRTLGAGRSVPSQKTIQNQKVPVQHSIPHVLQGSVEAVMRYVSAVAISPMIRGQSGKGEVGFRFQSGTKIRPKSTVSHLEIKELPYDAPKTKGNMDAGQLFVPSNADKSARAMEAYTRTHAIDLSNPRNSVTNWPMKRFHQRILPARSKDTKSTETLEQDSAAMCSDEVKEEIDKGLADKKTQFAFNLLDLDLDGELSRDEFMRFSGFLDAEAFDLIDKNGNGEVDFDELATYERARIVACIQAQLATIQEVVCEEVDRLVQALLTEEHTLQANKDLRQRDVILQNLIAYSAESPEAVEGFIPEQTETRGVRF